MRVLLLLVFSIVTAACGGGGGGGGSNGTRVTMTLAASAVSSTAVHLTWTPARTTPSSYVVYMDGTGLGNVYSSTSVTPGGLEPGTRYCFKIGASYFPVGILERSNKVCVSTLEDHPPTAPTNLGANVISPAQIDLTWNAATDDYGVVGYKLYRDGIVVATFSSATASDLNLEPTTQYCYRVAAYDTVGNESEKSNQSCGTTLADTLPPTTPDNLAVMYADAEDGTPLISLAWSPSTDDSKLAGYEIYRDGIYIGIAPDTAYVDYNINPLTTYCYSVLAYDKSGKKSESSSSECVTTSWSLNTIGCGSPPPDFVRSTSNLNNPITLDLDSNGMTHILEVGYRQYLDAQSNYITEKTLKYAYKQQDHWYCNNVGIYSTDDVYDQTIFSDLSLKIDSNDMVHIAYKFHPYELIYSTNISGYWKNENVVANESHNVYITGSSMALDSDNNAHICYIDWAVMYATNKNGIWEIATIEDTNSFPRDPSITVDKNNNIHVAYFDSSSAEGSALKYATNASGAWVITVLETAQDNRSLQPSIAIDPGQGVHIIYTDSVSKTLVHASNESGSWIKSVIQNNVEALLSNLDIDLAGRLHISYVDTSNHALYYSTNASNDWNTYLIDNNSSTAYLPSMRASPDDSIHIVYVGGTGFRYARTQ